MQCGLLSKCDEDAASWRLVSSVGGIQCLGNVTSQGVSSVGGIQCLGNVTSQGVHGYLLIHVEPQFVVSLLSVELVLMLMLLVMLMLMLMLT